jgi:EAL domain-containing protein (putative c-di-GMP-specific phosphodiesterase class I)
MQSIDTPTSLDVTAMYLVKQPIYSAHAGQPVAYEVLSRLSARDRLSRRDLQTLLMQLDDPRVLCRWFAQILQVVDLESHHMLSLNLSARHWRALLSCIRARHLGDPRLKHLCVELMDVPVAGGSATDNAILRDLQALGLRLALDDLGGPTTQLTHLLDWPVDWVKLDASLLLPSRNRQKVDRFLMHFVNFAQAEGLQLMIEGIESARQADRCVALGIDWQQGFYYGRPQ